MKLDQLLKLARRYLPALIAIAIAAASGSAISAALVVTVHDENGGPDRTVTVPLSAAKVKVDGADADRKRDDTITVPRTALAVAEATMEYAPQNRKGPAPSSGIAQTGTPEQQRAVAAYASRVRRTERPLPTAGASQGFPGCVTRFVVNQSSRRGVRPRQFWVHYTASPNRPGWGDVNAIVALFNRPSFQASSHFVIDNEGHCAYIVPIENKAWTQAGANLLGVNVEYINSGSEGRYCAPAGCAKLRKVALEVRRRTGIPVGQIGAVRSCTAARSGTVTHWMGGPCSGGHVDIKPYALAPLVAYFRRGSSSPTSPLSRYERKVIRGAARPKGSGHSRRYWCRANANTRHHLRRLGLNTKAGKARHRRARGHALAKSYRKRCRG